MDFSPKAVYVVSSSIETRIPIIDRESRNISQCNRVGLLVLLLIGKTWTFPLAIMIINTDRLNATPKKRAKSVFLGLHLSRPFCILTRKRLANDSSRSLVVLGYFFTKIAKLSRSAERLESFASRSWFFLIVNTQFFANLALDDQSTRPKQIKRSKLCTYSRWTSAIAI
jgi:hypothetical protein